MSKSYYNNLNKQPGNNFTTGRNNDIIDIYNTLKEISGRNKQNGLDTKTTVPNIPKIPDMWGGRDNGKSKNKRPAEHDKFHLLPYRPSEQGEPKFRNLIGKPFDEKKIKPIPLHIPKEKKEQERLKRATGDYDLKKIDPEKIKEYLRLKEKTPDDYYSLSVPRKELDERLNKEAFGPKTDFSVWNFENNYDKLNKEEQGMLIHKMQLAFNNEGYKDDNGYSLKTDGIFGNKTKSAYEKYKKNNIQEYMEAIENKILSSEIPKEQKRNMVESTVPEPAKLTLYSNENKSKGNSDTDKKTEKQSLSQWLDSGEDRWMEKHLKDQKVKERADQVIKDNTEHIINAAKEFGVNPGILAACIYSEHRRNMEFNDYYLDSALAALGKDSSLGVSQVLVSTAKSMEELGYMPKITMNEEGKWGTPDIGYNFDSETQARIKALEDAQTNIMYAAAYLKYIQDVWKEAYPEIDGRTAIMATLYNIGAYGTKGPHSNPQPIDFGNFAKDNYYYVRELMGI